MTTQQIEAMEAGPEMDIAIIEALVAASGERLELHTPRTANEFRPSTDWSDAMFAAEKFGLFDNYKFSQCLTCSTPHSWTVSTGPHGDTEPAGVASGFFANAETGPLAICRAILKLARDR